MAEHLTPAQVGRLLGIPANVVVELVRTKVLPGARRRGRTVIPTADLRRWIERKNEAAFAAVAGKDAPR